MDGMGMLGEQTFDFDEVGKIDLSDIYNKTDPRRYYSTLQRLNYIIPQTAKPVFQQVIDTYRNIRARDRVRIVDVGCSYGINAAILKGDLEMAELYSHYAPEAIAKAGRQELLMRDQAIVEDIVKDAELEVVGLDASPNAIKYAVEANLLDDGIVADLEHAAPTAEVAAVIDNADLVISTGCVGYVGESTFKNIIEVNAPNRPWMVNFVLRMFPFDDIAEALGEHGYVTEKVEGETFLQRRFASEEEQTHVLERLSDLGVEAQGLESEGWYHAEAFISCPREDCAALGTDFAEVLRGASSPMTARNTGGANSTLR